MLVLSRRPGESLRLGEDVEITVLKSSASGVSLGIKAPRSLAVLRGELAAAVLSGNRSAAESAPEHGALEEISRTLLVRAGQAADPAETKEPTGADGRPGRREARPKAPKHR